MNDKDKQYMVTCKNYDNQILILSTDDSFRATLNRNIEPDSLEIFDITVMRHNKKNLLKTLILIGEHLYQDTIDLDLCYD